MISFDPAKRFTPEDAELLELLAGIGAAALVGLLFGSVVTMIFGELVPKNLALARPMAVARATQRFQRGFTAVMRGPIRLLNGSANAVVRRLGIEPQEELRSAYHRHASSADPCRRDARDAAGAVCAGRGRGARPARLAPHGS